MTALLALSVSLSNRVTEVGAVAAVAGLVGIAALSLLLFSQSREIKRLREWAGRAPERAAELDRSRETRASGANPRFDQRASAEAALRIRRAVQPAGATATAPVPATAVTRAAAVAGGPLPGPAGASPAPILPAVPGVGSTNGSPIPGQPAFVPVVAQAPLASPPADPVPVAPTTAAAVAAAENELELAPAVDEPHELSVVDARPQPAAVEGAPRTIAPATVAAAAVAAAPSEAGASRSPAAVGVAAAPAAQAVATPVAAAPPRAPAPPLPPRATGPPPAAESPQSPPRPSAPPRPVAPPRAPSARATASRAGGSARQPAGERDQYRFLREEERSPRRATALIAGGVALGAVVLAVALLTGGGSGGGPAATTTSAKTSGASTPAHHAAAAPLANPAETHVVVVNATETNGLAHRLAGNLQRSGYTLAKPLSARPPGAHATSVVEYAHGHHREAEHVAQALGIGQTAPLEEALAPEVGGASVVVVAGADEATAAGTGEASSGEASNGEAPSGSEAAPGAGAGEG